MHLSRRKSLPLHANQSTVPCLPSRLPIIRYGSFGSRRIRLNPLINVTLDKSTEYAPKVPTEMLENIIEHYADISLSPPAPLLLRSQKHFFKKILPCTLVSKAFRHLSLRAFFRALVFSTTEDSSGLLRFLDLLNGQYLSKDCFGGYSWVRYLSSPSFLIPSNIKSLQYMVHLQGLRVDFSHSGLALQRSCLKQLFGSLTAYSSITNLTSLKLTELPRIDEHVLSLIATGLPNLVDAQFISIDSLDMECCPNCYEDSLTRISHSPVSDMYSDVIVLADVFGRALSPLLKLENIFFGIFLSPSNLLDIHINHNWKESELKPTTVETIYNCSRCAKYEKSTKQRELLASLLIAHHIDSLCSIGWASAFGERCPEIKESKVDDEDFVQSSGDRAADVRDYWNLASGPNFISAQEYLPLRLPCECGSHGLKTSLQVYRIQGKIKVARASGREGRERQSPFPPYR